VMHAILITLSYTSSSFFSIPFLPPPTALPTLPPFYPPMPTFPPYPPFLTTLVS
jgi:hypothetical protein